VRPPACRAAVCQCARSIRVTNRVCPSHGLSAPCVRPQCLRLVSLSHGASRCVCVLATCCFSRRGLSAAACRLPRRAACRSAFDWPRAVTVRRCTRRSESGFASADTLQCSCYRRRPRPRVSIWNPHHLDKTRRFRISRYIPVYTGMRFLYRLVLAYTAIYQTGMVYTCIYCIKEMMVFQSLGLCFPVESCMYTLPTYSKTHPGASSAKQSMFYPVELKLGTYMYIQVYTFMIKYIKVYTAISSGILPT
jgi:hypothetical protein